MRLGSPVVAMVQTAESGLRDNLPAIRRWRSAVRCLLGQAEMSAIFVVVMDIVREQPLEMLLINRDDVIEQIAPTTLDPALRDAVLPRALVRRLDRVDLHRSNGHRDGQTVLRIAIKNEEAGSRFERKRLSQLLHDPHARGMLRNVEIQNLPPVVADHEEAVEHAESDRRHREEIHCCDCFTMIS